MKGFFETGGQAVHILRLIGPGAQPAVGAIAEVWQISAATRAADLGIGLVGATPLPWQDRILQRHGSSIPDPGSWGNRLSLRIMHDATPSQPVLFRAAHREQLEVSQMTGLEPGAWVDIRQGNATFSTTLASVDTLRGQVVLADPLPIALDPDGPGPMLQVRTLTAELHFSGQRVELFSNLSPSVTHARHFAQAITRESQFVRVAPMAVTDADRLPEAGDYSLSGGRDGLELQTEADWLAALAAQAAEDEIALIAAPDLVRTPPAAPPVPDSAPVAPDLCVLPLARPRGRIEGELHNAETDAPIADVLVTVAGEGKTTRSDENGRFTLKGLPLGIVELRLFASGYLPADPLVQARIDASDAEPTLLRMMALQEVPALSPEAIARVQQAMLDPGLVGPFRIALLDPPAPEQPPEALLEWVSKLDRSARGFAVAPWIGVPDDGDDALLLCPPSGHVCGAFAAAEALQGVHRAPGNMVLRHVKSVPLLLDEALATECYRAALNLIEATPGRAIRLMGSRSLSANPDWDQVSVRRLFDALERTLLTRFDWAIFEPATPLTRQLIVFAIEEFLETLRRRGMFAGQTPEEAYSVRCDAELNLPASQARGELIAEIAIAPTRPYEFITFSLAAQAEALNVTEGA
ncbi:hypothetical protein LH51_10570 [Nitrincola sp. A-D6]|uniref:phage tail sheath C-terminal domain-containing protein n=1 Tax=Nitrincola sp. A-D6 TaxID=1545442 RepID=UPI00051F8829|nr:phage tail sheath C-terminal domain-containing protein [Nitrincola sp. A-D6]KGK41981.1 hypothetical protein LH51_10570 [Nitrincola sp. A-D6]